MKELKIFTPTNFEKNTIADFGQDSDGLKWYIKPLLVFDWDFYKIANLIENILVEKYPIRDGESFRTWEMSEIDEALDTGFPIAVVGDYIVTTYYIRSSRMAQMNFGDTKEECFHVCEKLSEKYKHLEHLQQYSLF